MLAVGERWRPRTQPPLITAARNGDLAAVRALVQQKADVKAAEGDGATALHWASYRDQLEIADVLLRAGADANAANDLGATPLWLAAQNGSAAMTRRLLQAGADPNKALARRRDAADGGGADRQHRGRRSPRGQGRRPERARDTRADGADVGRRAEAS